VEKQQAVETLSARILSTDMRDTQAWALFEEILGVGPEDPEEDFPGALHQASDFQINRLASHFGWPRPGCPTCGVTNHPMEKACKECGRTLVPKYPGDE